MPQSRVFLKHFITIFRFQNETLMQKLQADEVFSETSSCNIYFKNANSMMK
jgi:hypothetical protein